VDIVVTHAPPKGVGDLDDFAHRGFEALLPLLEKYRPQYLLHGHVHLRYSADSTRERTWADTRVINVCERYVLDLPDRPVAEKDRNRLIFARRVRNDD
jgi:Icc-related predicted phosphoesterase